MTDCQRTTRPVGASFAIPGDKLHLYPIHKFDLVGSGLSAQTDARPGRFFSVIGQRSVLLGEEGGCFEVWGHPFKYVSHGEFAFHKGRRVLSTGDLCEDLTVAPEAVIFTYSGEGLRVRQIIFAPIRKSGIVSLFEVLEGAPITISMSFRSDLKLMWPADWQERPLDYAFDEATCTWAVVGSMEEHTVMVGSPSLHGCSLDSSGGDRIVSVEVTPEAAADQYVAFVVAGSPAGVGHARSEYADIAQNIAVLYRETADYYRSLLEDTLSVETPDPELDEAYRWAKIGLDKCFIATPELGAGYVAGWNTSGDSGRPGFGWYFGRDSSWESFAACCYGQFDKVRHNLDLLAGHQIAAGDNRGKIYHELSAAHEFCFGKDYAYVAGDSTPFYVIDMAAYLRWTGDLDYIRRNWGHVRLAMDWCYRMDVDADLLIDNPPAGHQWYDYGEKNMVDLVAIWAQALEMAAWMGRMMNDSDAERWAADASKVRLILNADFWDSGRGYLYDRKLPDETFNDLTTANPSVPLLWGLIQPEKAQRAVNVLFGEGMLVPWGVRTNSNADNIYDPWGYHEGTVWPLVTGWASLAAYRNHRPSEGFLALKANADLTGAFCPGYIAEVLSGDERLPGGCPHQGWSEAMVILPLVEGLLGLEVDAVERDIRFSPHLPPDWSGMKAHSLRIGGDVFHLEVRRDEHSLVVRFEHSSGKGTYSAHLNPAIPRDGEVKYVLVNGKPMPEDAWSLHRTVTDCHIEVRAELTETMEVVVAL